MSDTEDVQEVLEYLEHVKSSLTRYLSKMLPGLAKAAGQDLDQASFEFQVVMKNGDVFTIDQILREVKDA